MEGLRPEWAAKAIVAIVTVSILLSCASAATKNHTVGGVSGWDLTSNLQAWTSETAFYVGDSLVFSYTPVHDVIEVDHDDYQSCDASNPISTHDEGETVFPLSREGTRYFICGRRGHCRMGLKLQVRVFASDGGGRNRPLPPGSPSAPELPDVSIPPVPAPGGRAPAPAPAPEPCDCSAAEAAEGFFHLTRRLVMVVMIILVASWSPRELGFVYALVYL